MPGVLIVELWLKRRSWRRRRLDSNPARRRFIFLAIDKVKFRKPVIPGDALILEVVPLRKGGAVWKMRGEARVDGTVVAEAEFVAVIKNISAG